ncbi:MAG: hypothetical protein P8L68_03455 [Paracoccaceae bacterium]|nr:hypothetical protein [Paracoccaceae bacterium]
MEKTAVNTLADIKTVLLDNKKARKYGRRLLPRDQFSSSRIAINAPR